MQPIEWEVWERSPDDSGKMRYVRQRTGQEVFGELRDRLEGMGYFPEEYFLLGRDWRDGREIPRDAEFFCSATYAGAEGIRLNVDIRWWERGKHRISTFATGMILGRSGSDLDRMFLAASAATQAFYGGPEEDVQYVRPGEQPEDRIAHLNVTEQSTIIQALTAYWERQKNVLNQVDTLSQTERLLRRMTGSITAYMDKVRQRPLDISDYDRAVLAIRDGALEEFEICCPRVPDQLDSLLVEAAGKAGMAGQKMTLALLDHAGIIPPEVYTAACKQAVDTGDVERVRELLEQAGDHLAKPCPALTGEVIIHAYEAEYQNIGRALIQQCTPEQIAAAPPPLLRQVVWGMDLTTAEKLVEKGVQPGDYVVDVLHFLTGLHEEQEARELLEKGMPVEPDNYCALYVCINNQVPGIAKLLLDRGMDLDRYRAWAEKQPKEAGYAETMEEVSAYWAERKGRDGPERPGPSMGGMRL